MVVVTDAAVQDARPSGGPGLVTAEPAALGMGLRRIATSYTVADVCANVLAVVGMWLLIRYLSMTDFGVSDLLRAVQGSLVPVLSLNVFMSAGRFYFEAHDDVQRRRILGGALTVQSLAGLVGAALIVLCQPLGQRFVHAGITPSLGWLVAMSVPPTAVVMALSQTAILKGSVGAYAAITMCQGILNVTGIVVLIVWKGGGIADYFLGLLVAAWITAVGGYLVYHRHFQLGWHLRPLRAYIHLGAPYTAAAGIQYAYVLFIRIALIRLASAQALAFYAVAERLQQPLTVVVAAVGRSWVPWLLQARRPAETVRRAARDLNGMVLIVAAGTIVFLPEVITVLAGSRYAGVSTTAFILLCGSWVYFVGDWIVSAGLFIAKESRWVPLIYLGAYATGALLAILVVPWAGSVGAAASACASSVLLLLAMAAVARRVWPVDVALRHFVPASLLALATAAATGAFVPLALKPLVLVLLLGLMYVARVLPSWSRPPRALRDRSHGDGD